MASIRKLIDCLDMPNATAVSLKRRFLGQAWGYPPATNFSADTSLLQHASRINGSNYINVNLILVGHEAFTDTDRRAVSGGVRVARAIFETVGIGLGRVEWHGLSIVHAPIAGGAVPGYYAERISDLWMVDNNGIDAFIVLSIEGSLAGFSPVDGPCQKATGEGSDTSFFIETFPEFSLSNRSNKIGTTIVHELIHYMGIEEHSSTPGDLFLPEHGIDDINMTSGQARGISGHCAMNGPCNV